VKRWKLVLAMLTIVGLPIAVVIGMPVLVGHGAEPQEDPQVLDRGIAKELNELMRRKLENSQKVLEGIVLSDFDKIARHANELIAISKQAEWQVLKTPEYESYSNDLRRNAEVLIQHSKEKNLDGTVLAYVDLTLTCVKCHKHVREAR
jgi:hypothetical protein